MLLSDVCLSVAYIGNNSRTERPRKVKIGTQVAHVTRDSDTAFKVKRSKVKDTRPVYSPRRLRTGSYSGQRGNVLSVGNCCYIAVCRRAHTESRGTGAYRVATRTACSICICNANIADFTTYGLLSNPPHTAHTRG